MSTELFNHDFNDDLIVGSLAGPLVAVAPLP